MVLPALEDDEVLVRIVGTGVCHTDLIPKRGGFAGHRPLITGHEGAGVVEQCGASVQRLTVGDHVVLSFDSCGSCRACGDGHPAYCDTFLPRNLSGRGVAASRFAHDDAGHDIAFRWFGQSSFATVAIARERNAVRVDKDLPLDVLGPLGCGIQTGAGSITSALGATAEDAIAVIGAGAVGLAAVMAARRISARHIVAVDVHPSRLQLARHFGAHHVAAAGDTVTLQAIAAETGGFDIVFDTSGHPDAIRDALACLAPRGTCGLVGAMTEELVIPPAALRMGKRIVSIYEGDVDPQQFIPEMIEWWRAGTFPFDELIERFPLSAVNEAFEASSTGRVVKPVLVPDESDRRRES